LLREFFDAPDGALKGLLRSSDVFCVNIGELFLQLVTGKVIDRLAHISGAVLDCIDHPGNDERKLDLSRGRVRSLVLAGHQVSRIHRVCCVPDRVSKRLKQDRLKLRRRTLSFVGIKCQYSKHKRENRPRLQLKKLKSEFLRVIVAKNKGSVMLRYVHALASLIWIGLMVVPAAALAATVEVARTCQALTAKAYPPREIGNPAAGSAKGSGRVQQEYFRKCVANGGKVDDNASK
jgi:hypothetical protein